MLASLPLAIRFLWRDWRAGEWYIVFLALLLAIAATTSIHFYTDRLHNGLEKYSTKFLGGDLAVSSSTPIPVPWQQKAESLHLQTAEVWSYASVVSIKHQLQLVYVEAVSGNYPLIHTQPLQLERNTIWVEPRLLALLSVKVSDTLKIGVANFQIARILTNDIDLLNTGWIIAPRVLMRLEDVKATKTVLPGSRVDYRLLMVGETKNLNAFRQWITPQLAQGQTLLDVQNQQFGLKAVLQRLENYIQLLLLFCLLMSGVAIGLSVQQYLRRHYSYAALWRCLGAQQDQIRGIFLWQLAIIALVSGVIAVSIGYLAQHILAHLFQNFFQFSLPKPSLLPAFLGIVTSVLLLFSFAYPIIHELPSISPLFLWRQEVAISTLKNSLYFAIAFALISVFVGTLMDFSSLVIYFLCVLLFCIGFLYFLSMFLLSRLQHVLQYTNGFLRRGISQLTHHAKSFSLQFIGFNLIFISIIVLSLVRTHLIENWLHTLPQRAPNYFAFNIAQQDLPAIKYFFVQQHLVIDGIYPMVRGRLVLLNGKPILSAVPEKQRQNNALHRELNLSWMWNFPADNKIVRGLGWSSAQKGQPLVSIENKLAEDLQLHVGDTLTFQVGEKKLAARVANIRTVEWTSFHPNFFMIFLPGLFDNFPVTYVTSFYLSADQTLLLNDLVLRFPNITIVDMASLLGQMQDLVSKISLAIEYLFLFSLGIGILIFITSLQASMDERRLSYRLWRVLGASNKYIYSSIAAEFSCFGLLVFGSAIGLAYLIVYFLEVNVFGI
jgi:putative ABC transport system permease protein